MKQKLFSYALVGCIILILGIVLFVKLTPTGEEVLSLFKSSHSFFLPLVIVSAVIDSINPCAFSILLLTITFLFSLGADRKKIFSIGGSYILGVFLVYLAIGLGILNVLSFFNIPNFVGKVGAMLIILLGILDIINTYIPSFPIKLKIPKASHKTMARLMEKSSIPASFALGAFVGLCEFPCTGGPYLMILGLLHDSRTFMGGFGYLLLYNVLFIAPLLIILGIASKKTLVDRFDAWRKDVSGKLRFIDGAIMIGMGVLIFLLS
ncbi:MAG: cytochrome c bioproteinis protein, transmembrane region [Parcubacteria group bacterium LiPW_41]|nr:MAG: cytochrome c bioproteinis protein, transmembrane region [Parcubacteria group bacterium LiPW_41]